MSTCDYVIRGLPTHWGYDATLPHGDYFSGTVVPVLNTNGPTLNPPKEDFMRNIH